MKTKIVSLLLLLGIVLSVFALASCNGKEKAVVVTATPETADPGASGSADATTAVTTSPSETTAPETEPPDDEYTKNY